WRLASASLLRDSCSFRSFVPRATAPSGIYTLSLHDALPIYVYWHNSDIRNVEGIKEEGLRRSYSLNQYLHGCLLDMSGEHKFFRSEEHTSELQSRFDLVCRLLLEKKKTSITAQP